ncbi:YciI family protein [Streptomyces sp. NPDC004647]|uniref:YciI family protein n=1 Tax=Streptomyces sp. NPDC004647 TaxID=3154671 RepID=UPI0033B860CF
MKYMLMILGKQSDYEALRGEKTDGPAWTEQDRQAMFDFMGAVNKDLAEAGELIDAQGLTEPAEGRLVTSTKDGEPVVTDGPYGEAKEVLAGYWLLECESIERATEIAARVYQCPVPEGAPNYPVVVRPVG